MFEYAQAAEISGHTNFERYHFVLYKHTSWERGVWVKSGSGPVLSAFSSNSPLKNSKCNIFCTTHELFIFGVQIYNSSEY